MSGVDLENVDPTISLLVWMLLDVREDLLQQTQCLLTVRTTVILP